MFSFLATYYRKGIIRYFERNTSAKSLTLIAFLVVLGAFAALVHEGFYYGFLYVTRDAFFGEAVSVYIIELFLLISSFLTFTSALVSGVVSLYRDDDAGLVLSSPSYTLKPKMVLARMFFSSLWPLLVVIVPALLAIMRVFPIGVLGFIAALFASVFLIFVAVQAAMLVIHFIAAILASLAVFSRRSVMLSTILLFFGSTLLIANQFRSIDLVAFFQARLLSKDVPDLAPILEQFHLFPSHIVTMIVYYSEQGMVASALLLLGALALLAAFLFTVFMLTIKSHLAYWQIAQEHKGAGRHTRGGFRGATLLMNTDRPERALLAKEFILFARNVRGMLWLAFILVVWGVQSASSFLLKHGLGDERVSGVALPGMTIAFQFALITYFVSMFALRFAFPSFSEERKSGWVVESTPLSRTSVFRSKLYFFSVLFSALAILFTLLNASIVGITGAMLSFLLLFVVITVVTITTYALALGALFPNTETDDPEVLSTTLPGLMFIAVSVFYGIAGALAFRGYFASGAIIPVLLYVSFSIVTVILFLLVTKRNLERK